MSGIMLVYVLYGDRAAAQQTARAMVEQRLAACANILGAGQSIYRWDGQIEQADEFPVLFKTATERSGALIAAIEAAHSYELPAVLTWPAGATAAYADWVARETGC